MPSKRTSQTTSKVPVLTPLPLSLCFHWCVWRGRGGGSEWSTLHSPFMWRIKRSLNLLYIYYIHVYNVDEHKSSLLLLLHEYTNYNVQTVKQTGGRVLDNRIWFCHTLPRSQPCSMQTVEYCHCHCRGSREVSRHILRVTNIIIRGTAMQDICIPTGWRMKNTPCLDNSSMFNLSCLSMQSHNYHIYVSHLMCVGGWEGGGGGGGCLLGFIIYYCFKWKELESCFV